MSHAGWALTGLALGAVGGFFAGRHGQVTGSGGILERIAVGTSHAVTAVGRSGAETMEGVVIGESGRLKGLIPLDATPQQTLRHILAIPDSLNRLAALKEWCRTLPPDQALEVMQEFKGMMEAQERIGEVEGKSLFFVAIDVLAEALLEQGPGKVLAVFLAPEAEGGDAGLRLGLGAEIFKKWAERDPAAARVLLESRLAAGGKIGQVENVLSIHLMRAWVKKDPDAAMGWLLKQPTEVSDEAVSPAFDTLSLHDPDKARKLVAEQADLPGRVEIAATIAQAWAKTTPDKALEWAQGLPEKLSGPSVKKTMETWAGQDFPAAKQALEGLSGSPREAALPVLVENWQKNNWGEAAGFLEQQPAGKGRQEAVGQLIRRWADGDQPAASGWLARQAPGPERDAGASALVDEVRDSDPEAAAIWGATLGDEKQRQDSLRETLQGWYKKSVPEALRWVETAGNLTDSDRAALLRMMAVE
jgi:hypothetical protein